MVRIATEGDYVPWYSRRACPVFCYPCVPAYMGIWPARFVHFELSIIFIWISRDWDLQAIFRFYSHCTPTLAIVVVTYEARMSGAGPHVKFLDGAASIGNPHFSTTYPY